MRPQTLFFLFCVAFCGVLSAQETIYFNDFETGDLEVEEYVGDPVTSENIEASSWYFEDGFNNQPGFEDSSGLSIRGNGTKIITLTINIEEGFQLDLSGFRFWTRKTNNSKHGWTFSLGNREYASGKADENGDFITGDFDSVLVGLTEEVEFIFTVNGMGNGNFILDNFELFGQVTPICDEDFIESQPQDEAVCSGGDAEFSVTSFTVENKTYQWQVLVDGDWEDLTNEGAYDNVNSSTLSIVNTTDDLNQNEYRCIVIEDECEEISDQAMLTVIPLPETQPIQYTD